ncbi:exonuclease domain-containing protein [uncultured Cocleimonas sp.]|uniref:exonuclease domain-containing protein n=1 Tax=uncultured Cocleimonas sp. TaxID=1051587 RepID=UPI0026055514|nr:exonuclease domain-containing protein [uncultured Cocleimonas sp.]
MFSLFTNPDKKRQKLLEKVENEILKDYLSTPMPDLKLPASEVEFLALDFETTGLDANKEAILSIGCTLIKDGRVKLSENSHHFIQVNREIPPESVVIHKITDDRAQTGEHLHNVLEMLLEKMKGRVLLVHYDKIERNFFNAACKEIYGDAPPLLIVDTLAIAQKRQDKLPQGFTPNSLRLFNLRAAYGLPRYNAHSALEDAIATAELFLAQMANGDGLERVRLKDLLSK